MDYCHRWMNQSILSVIEQVATQHNTHHLSPTQAQSYTWLGGCVCVCVCLCMCVHVCAFNLCVWVCVCVGWYSMIPTVSVLQPTQTTLIQEVQPRKRSHTHTHISTSIDTRCVSKESGQLPSPHTRSCCREERWLDGSKRLLGSLVKCVWDRKSVV